MPHLFGDNMVIQRDQPIKVWGTANQSETIDVFFTGGGINQNIKAKADKNGNWHVLLKPVSDYSNTYTLTVKGKNDIFNYKNVLVGDVWLSSGQSNMEWQVKNSANANFEISNARYSQIRSFDVGRNMGMLPLSDVTGSWKVCSPQTVGDFSAVAYFFARKLHKETGVPIGILHSSWGGTDVETWISPDSFKQLPEVFHAKYAKNRFSTDFNFEKFMKENQKNKALFEQAMSSKDLGLQEEWHKPNTELLSWKELDVPALWSNEELVDLDGIVWCRYDFDLPEGVSGMNASLNLGAIDDDDITWMNGIRIGETNGYNVPRNYVIPSNVLKSGKNTLVVRVVDNTGGGGLYGNPEDIMLRVNDKQYPLAGTWKYKVSVSNKEYNYVNLSPNMYSSLLYNAMIHPLISYAIKGAIWYQGENNASQAYNYRTLFPLLITDWRSKWGNEFPFYWVQLANFMAEDKQPSESEWAELREAQTMTLSLPRTGQALAIDIGDANDIHPRNKQDVGLRLALMALNKDYGRKDVVYAGPSYKSMEIQGNKVILTFDNIASGLLVSDKYGYVHGFSIAGKDKQFVWAKAFVENNKVIVYHENIMQPVAVRYNWGNNPDGNLYNKEGLPACPFRTDKE